MNNLSEHSPEYYCYYTIQKVLEHYFKIDNGKLTNEREKMVEELKAIYNSISPKSRGDVLIPANAKDVIGIGYDYNTHRYFVEYNWAEEDTKPETRKMKELKKGEQCDRVGEPTGNYVCAIGDKGVCSTCEQRSIPYYFTNSNIINAINNSDYLDKKKDELRKKIYKYYNNEKKIYGTGDGLAYGEIAPMFEDKTGFTGGGYQYKLPLSIDELMGIGMLSEIPKWAYCI